jgi:hypothetical protein
MKHATGVRATPEATPEARSLVRALRRRWRLRVAGGSLLRALASGAAGVALLILFDLVTRGATPGALPLLRWVPLVAGGAFLLRGALLLAAPPSDRELALEAEARDPGLDHLFLTTLIPGTELGSGGLAAAFLARARTRLRQARPERLLPLDLSSTAGWAAGVAFLALILVLTTPGGPSALWARWGAGSVAGAEIRGTGIPGGPGAAAMAGPFLARSVSVQVTPPGYTGLPRRPVPADAPLVVLPGSRVTVEGDGVAPSAEVVGGTGLGVDSRADGWSLAWTVTPDHRGLLLRRTSLPGGDPDEHLLALELATDLPPVVELEEPSQDLVLATGEGHLSLRARALDDHGIADLRLTWVRTRGGGESFAFDQGELDWDVLEPGGEGVLLGAALLPLQRLELRPGDVVHLRAVALDGNDVTGPGVGVSSTRILRIALPEEAHLVTSLVGLPLEVERDPVLSQRMILLLTQRLLADIEEGLPRDSILPRSVQIAGEQRRLREQVGEQVYVRATGAMQEPTLHLGYQETEEDPAQARADERFRSLPPALLPDSLNELLRERERRELQTHGGIPDDPTVGGGRSGRAVLSETGPEGHTHDASPILSVNNDLLRVHDWMWEAERFLLQGEAQGSIPSQELALAELQRIREAERVFARGRTTVAPVDVPGVRGTGRAEGVDPGSRRPGDAVPSSSARAGALEELAKELASLPTQEGLRRLRAQAVLLLGEPGIPAVVPSLLSRAATTLGEGRGEEATRLVLQAREALSPGGSAGGGRILVLPGSPLEGGYLARLRQGGGP